MNEKLSLQDKAKKLVELEAEFHKRQQLPHLYGWKWYGWAREFFDSTNKMNFLCAANQISKSSTQIRKCIDWATNIDKWPSLWQTTPDNPGWSGIPEQFWYLYPTNKQVDEEFEHKWKQFLPKGEMKNDPQYGWEEFKVDRHIGGIRFFSGVTVYFKTYMQNVTSLQTGSIYAIFCDEELPENLYQELVFRISATDGYFHMVFTATLGQEFWRKVIQPTDEDEELLKGSYKKVVSSYDCQFYMDGSPSRWTIDKIKIVENRCKSHTEVLKRVYGHFIIMEDLKYPEFDVKRHMKKHHHIPKDWIVYAGIDYGGGGEGHKSAIVFTGVSPNYKHGRIFLAWRGDDGYTTADDVIKQYQKMVKVNNLTVTQVFFDQAAKDLEIISNRMGMSWQPAAKGHELGESIIGVLFKNDMIAIYDTIEGRKLAKELASLKKTTKKNKAKDDLTDGFRYSVTRIPWDWTGITSDGKATVVNLEGEGPVNEKAERRKRFDESRSNAKAQDALEAEISEWNSLLSGF